jgi:hypothetical protein
LLQQPTMRRTRFHTVRLVAVLYLGLNLGIATEFVLIMVKASQKNGVAMIAFVAFFAIVTLLLLSLGALILGLMRPVTVTRSVLRIPIGFRTAVIPLTDVAGVGLQYRTPRPPRRSPGGWFVYVWRRDGTVQRVPSLICRQPADARPSDIAASRAGRMARRLDNKVRAIQGPMGTLATLELQKHARVGLTDNQLAFWSPDGEMGPTRY